jgi:1,4-dihydroxy-2-naphthoate polyprenyltransferase
MPTKGGASQSIAASAGPRNPRYWRGVWRFADPKITLASISSMALGLGFAWRDGPIAWGWVGIAAIGIFALEAAKNASGEIVDWRSGADSGVAERDRSPFSGGKRVLVDGLMTSAEAAAFAAAAYASGIATGLAIAAWHEPRVLWLGVAGVGAAFFYHAPPLGLSYRGLGELSVAITYGPGICLGTYLVARQAVSPWPALAATPLGLLIGAFLWINEFPDRAADAVAGKRTLVVRLGARRSSRVFAALVASAYALTMVMALSRGPLGLLGGLAGLPLHVAAAHRLWRAHSVTADIIPAQRWTLLGFVAYAAGSAVFLMIDPR